MGEPTMMQRHTGQVPDFGDKNGMIPYVFGSKCIRLKDETERIGWKGAGNRTERRIARLTRSANAQASLCPVSSVSLRVSRSATAAPEAEPGAGKRNKGWAGSAGTP